MKLFLNILSGVGLLLWFACFTLGYNFQEGGALTMSILLGVFILVVMTLLIYLLKRWSHPTGSDHKANALSKEIVCVVIYLVVVVLTASGVAQFITVESSVRSEVTPLARNRMQAIDRVFGDSNVSGSYLAYVEEKSGTLEEKEKAQYAHQGLSSEQIDKNVAVKVDVFESNVIGEKYDHLAGQAKSLLDKAGTAIGYWNPFTVCENLAKLDNEPAKWAEELKELSTQDEWTKNEPYEASFGVSSEDNLLNWVQDPIGGVFSGMAILLIIVMQIMIILTYFVNRDWEISGPRKPKNSDVTFRTLKQNNVDRQNSNNENIL